MRQRVIQALINYLGGLAVTVLGIGIGAVTLDAVINDSAVLLSRGIWLSVTGLFLSVLYVIIYTLAGE